MITRFHIESLKKKTETETEKNTVYLTKCVCMDTYIYTENSALIKILACGTFHAIITLSHVGN